MSFTLIGSQIAVGNSASPPSMTPFDSTGADLMVVLLSGSQSFFSAPDDGVSTFIAATPEYEGSNSSSIRIYYAVGAGVSSASYAVNYFNTGGSDNGRFGAIVALAFSGADAVPFDQNTTGAEGGSSAQPGSLTPSGNGALVVSVLGNVCSGFSINSGFTIDESANESSGQNYGLATAHLIQGAAASVNPTWSFTGTGSTLMAVFLPADAGGGDTGQPTMRRWGGVPYVGGQGIGNKSSGKMWGRTRQGIYVPRRFAA